MKNIIIFVTTVCILFCGSYPSFAEDVEDLPPGISELPQGMEIIKVGSANIIAPIGSRVYKQGTMIIVEPIEQYAARRFVAMEARFAVLERQLKEFQKDIQELKEIVDNIGIEEKQIDTDIDTD